MRIGRFFGRDDADSVTLPEGGTVLASRDREGVVHVDEAGAVLPAHLAVTDALRWSVRTGDGWSAAADAGGRQRLDGAAVETTVKTTVGPVAHRLVVGVVGGGPAAIIEVTNDASVAVAIGFDFATPAVFADGLLRSSTGQAAFVAPTARAATEPDDPACVIPLPHGASTTVVMPLSDDAETAIRAGSSVPAVADVTRGWDLHLGSAFQVVTGEPLIDEAQRPLQRAMLTLDPPEPDDAWAGEWVAAMSECGFASEVDDELWRLDGSDPHDLLYAVGRWLELGGEATCLDEILEPFARAVHNVARHKGVASVPLGWSESALAAAVRGATAIEQPDIAQRIGTIEAATVQAEPPPTRATLLAHLGEASTTWSWSQAQSAQGPALALRMIRHLVVDESGPGVQLLPAVPLGWRGKPIECHTMRVGSGALSWGVRWHGPRAALLWELDRGSEDYFRISCPGIDPAWEAIEESGETLLADPGWDRPGA